MLRYRVFMKSWEPLKNYQMRGQRQRAPRTPELRSVIAMPATILAFDLQETSSFFTTAFGTRLVPRHNRRDLATLRENGDIRETRIWGFYYATFVASLAGLVTFAREPLA